MHIQLPRDSLPEDMSKCLLLEAYMDALSQALGTAVNDVAGNLKDTKS
jgi:hypothetical protein